jgi:hypothetical protein
VAVAVLIGSTIDAVAVAVAVAMAGSEHIGYQSLRIYGRFKDRKSVLSEPD